MLALSKKCSTQIGAPIPYMYLKGMKIWGCVLIIEILTRPANKIPLGCPELIKSWTSWLIAAFYVFLIVTWVIIRLPSMKMTKSRHPSLLCLVLFVTQRTKGVYSDIYILNLGVMLKCMLMMWSPRLGKMRDSSLTWQRPSTTWER
jgi:hypothetical protein